MCPDADCADIVCNFPLLYVQRYAPVHGPQRVLIHPLGRRNVLAARQNCRCARLRILEKFLQRFHDFHLSPVHTADRIAEAVHLIAPQAIAKYGTEAQKQKYLPRLTKGGELGAFALTEPGAGSDAARAQTTAILDTETNEYVLNGTKCFISGGSRAGVLVVFALTNPAAGLKGMSAIIVEAGTPGFTVGKVENKMGLRGSETAELIFEDCRVPAENLLGQEGKDFKICMQTLNVGRIGIAGNLGL